MAHRTFRTRILPGMPRKQMNFAKNGHTAGETNPISVIAVYSYPEKKKNQ
jgi:hypothetical protein